MLKYIIAFQEGRLWLDPPLYGLCWNCKYSTTTALLLCVVSHLAFIFSCGLTSVLTAPPLLPPTYFIFLSLNMQINLRPVLIWIILLSAFEKPVLMRTCRNWIIDACIFLSLIISKTDSLLFFFLSPVWVYRHHWMAALKVSHITRLFAGKVRLWRSLSHLVFQMSTWRKFN